MIRRLLFRPEARKDISRAAHWYEQERPGLGERFLADLGEYLDRISTSPALFPLVEEGIRRCGLRRFPYAIYFLIEEPDVVVIAVNHRRRDPDIWKRRT